MVKVQTGETLDQATGAWADIRSIKKTMGTDKTVADTLRGLGAKEGGDDVVQDILGLPDKVPYFVAQKLRSRLQSMADVFSIENKRAPALGIIKNAAGQVDQAIEKGLQDFSPDAADLWRYANATYKGANEEFNNEFLRGLLKTIERKKGGMPEEVIDALIIPRKFSDVQRVKQAVTPETWSNIQQGTIQRLWGKSGQDPSKFKELLVGPQGLGREKLNVLYTPEQQHWMMRFTDTVAQTLQKGDTTGKQAIQLMQPGAMLGIGAGLVANIHPIIPAGATTILLGPPMLAKVMLSPTLSKMFVEGLRTPATSHTAGAVVGRLLNALVPRTVESDQSSRGVERMQPTTQDAYGGLNLP
jgi:hypothetical protein